MKPAKTLRQHHEGFKQKLIEKAGNTRKLAYLKTIAESPNFVEVETAVNNTIKGAGGVLVDHDVLLKAIIAAHAKHKDQNAYLPFNVKASWLNNALKKAEALRIALEKADCDYSEITKVVSIQNRLRNRKEQIRRDHDFNLTRSRKKYEGLEAEQAVFCRWLCVYLRMKYPNKLFAALIAAVARCLFNDVGIDDGRVKNNLSSNLAGIDQRAEKQRAGEKHR